MNALTKLLHEDTSILKPNWWCEPHEREPKPSGVFRGVACGATLLLCVAILYVGLAGL